MAAELDVQVLLDALASPAFVVQADGATERANGAARARWGAAVSFAFALPEAHQALRTGRTLPAGIEQHRLGAGRLLVVERRGAAQPPALASALPPLDTYEDETALAQALARRALARGVRCAAVVALPDGQHALPLAIEGGARELAGAKTVLAASRWPALLPLQIGQEGALCVQVRALGRGQSTRLALVTWNAGSDLLLEHALDELAKKATHTLGQRRAAPPPLSVGSAARAAAFRTVAESVSEALWLADAQGQVLVCNQPAVVLSGEPLANLSELASQVPGDGFAADELLRAIAQGRPARAHVVLRTGARERHADLTLTPLRDETGRLDGFVASARDLGAEQARVHALEGLVRVGLVTSSPLPPRPLAQALVEQIGRSFGAQSVALWLADAAQVEALGADAFAREPLAAAGTGADRLRDGDAFAGAVQAPEPLLLLDGERLVAAVGLTLHDGRRGVLVLSGALSAHLADLTVSVNRQGMQLLATLVTQALELARSWSEADGTRATFRAALAALPDAVMVVGLDGCLQKANDSARFLLAGDTAPDGRPLEELLRALDLRDGENRPVEGLARIALAGRTHVLDASIAAHAEQRRQVTVHAIPLIAEEGTALGAMLVAHDVTRERELERMKDTFLSMAAHELRTPLTAMKTWAQFTLRQMLKGDDPARVRRSLEGIERQTDKMATLVDDLLDVSRLTMGRLALRPERVDLAQLVRASCEEMGSTTSEHEIEVQAEGALFAQADPTRIGQVLTNLLANAVKYSPGGGTIRVEAERSGDHAVIRVHDQGVGIAPERVAHVFDRFYRAHDDPRLGSGGLGLGLWIAREIVQRHGGSIGVDSALGVGSVFRVLLPLAPG